MVLIILSYFLSALFWVSICPILWITLLTLETYNGLSLNTIICVSFLGVYLFLLHSNRPFDFKHQLLSLLYITKIMYVWLCGMFGLLTSPDDRTLFMYSRKDSSLISLSVKRKLMPLPCWPAVLYKPFRSSIRLAVLYELAKNRMHQINEEWKWIINVWN